MANIIVSNVCNMHCPYCFADAHMHATDSVNFIDIETFEARLDFLDRSGIEEIRLLGGEPTLHPRFAELVKCAQKRNKHIVVFTHGVLSETALSALESLAPDSCTVLINTNATRQRSIQIETDRTRRNEVLSRLGGRALVGFTIYTPQFSLKHLVDLIEETGCRRTIRLGLAQPELGRRNKYLHPQQYPAVGQAIMDFARQVVDKQITLEFDCGFVRCMFTEDDLEFLHHNNINIGWRCNPILDIDINEQVLHCFSLATDYHTRLPSDVTAAELRDVLEDRLRPFRTVGVYRSCSSCAFKRNGGCMGGCMAQTLLRFRRHGRSMRLQVPDALFAAGKEEQSTDHHVVTSDISSDRQGETQL